MYRSIYQSAEAPLCLDLQNKNASPSRYKYVSHETSNFDHQSLIYSDLNYTSAGGLVFLVCFAAYSWSYSPKRQHLKLLNSCPSACQKYFKTILKKKEEKETKIDYVARYFWFVG